MNIEELKIFYKLQGYDYIPFAEILTTYLYLVGKPMFTILDNGGIVMLEEGYCVSYHNGHYVVYHDDTIVECFPAKNAEAAYNEFKKDYFGK